MKRGWYKFSNSSKVVIISGEPIYSVGKVVCRYTSDDYNHSAKPHKRYVVYVEEYRKGDNIFHYENEPTGAQRIDDVCEEELMSYKSWKSYISSVEA